MSNITGLSDFTVWEQRKLGDITDSFSGGTPTANNSDYYNGHIPFIRSGEINSDTTELFITEEAIKCSSAKFVNKGNILYALYGATSGEVGISRINGAINQAVLAIRPRFGDDSYFISQWLRKQKQRIISTYLQGGQGNLSGGIIKKLMIDIPISNEEQIKISFFFKQLDDTIALHQEKLDRLHQLKKGYLQVMFPLKDEKVPKVRFADFKGNWRKCKVENIAEKKTGGGTPRTTAPSYWNGNIPWIQSSDLTEHNVSEVNVRKHITRKGLDESSSKIIPKDSIAIVSRVGVGKISLVQFEYTTSQDFLSLSELKVNKWFGVYSMYNVLQKELTIIQGTSIKGITKKDLLNKTLMVPEHKIEQYKIGIFLKHLDEVITTHQHKIDNLKLLKKAYLQKMFM